MKYKIAFAFIITVLAIGAAFAALAWVNPTDDPPGGNLAVPFTASTPNTVNYVTKFTDVSSAYTIGNSLIFDNGTNVGIGTASPGNYKLNVSGPASMTETYSSYVADGLFGATALPSVVKTPGAKEIRFGYIDNGIGGYSPRIGFWQDTSGSVTAAQASIGLETNGKLSIGAGASNATAVTIDQSGNVGIGTAGPGAHLDVYDNVASAGPFFRVRNADAINGGGIQFTTNNAQGQLNMLNASGAVSGSLINTTGGWQWNTQLNIMNGNVGIGETSPAGNLDIKTNTNGHAIIDDYACGDYAGFGAVTTMSCTNYTLLGNTTDTFLNTPGASGVIYFRRQNGTLMNLTGTTLTVGSGTGKINAGTVDPIYNINGEKYATYVAAMTGQKEETAGMAVLSDGTYEIDFGKAAKGSDLWLFWQVTDFGKNWENLSAMVSAGFDGRVWYEKDPAGKKLVIYGVTDNLSPITDNLEVSYRLTAPRFDHEKWGNVSTDSADGIKVESRNR